MVALQSTMLPLGTKLPPFELKNYNPKVSDHSVLIDSNELASTGYLVAFISNHCPFVINLAAKFGEIANNAQNSGLSVVAINSNDVSRYPTDHPEHMPDFADKYQFNFPYLFDESQSVPMAFKATCTPDFFLFDGTGSLVYRGQFDESRPGNGIESTGADLQLAIEHILLGKQPLSEQSPSIGCSIKWLPENEAKIDY